MTPLIQAPSVILQFILSLCTVSIATCNKRFENMMPFYGDNNKTKILGTVNGKTFYWKIDAGFVVTCMNINSFETAFGKNKEEQKEYKTDIFIKKSLRSHSATKASLPFVNKSTNSYQKSRRERGPGKILKIDATSEHQNHTGASTSTLCSSTKRP